MCEAPRKLLARRATLIRQTKRNTSARNVCSSLIARSLFLSLAAWYAVTCGPLINSRYLKHFQSQILGFQLDMNYSAASRNDKRNVIRRRKLRSELLIRDTCFK